ncbi:MAG: hypothetical protein WAV13_14765, partial [Thermodesulfovibrionales bacterium]
DLPLRDRPSLIVFLIKGEMVFSLSKICKSFFPVISLELFRSNSSPLLFIYVMAVFLSKRMTVSLRLLIIASNDIIIYRGYRDNIIIYEMISY